MSISKSIKEELSKEELSKEELSKEELSKEELSKEELSKEELKMIKDAEEYSYPFYIKPGSQYEYKLVDEAKLLVYTGGIDALALLSYQASRTNFKKRTLRDRFFAGLAYSEFLAIDSSDDNALYAASIQRGTYCKRINIDGFELFKKVERMYDCTRYPE